MHTPDTVVMGATQLSDGVVIPYPGNPTTLAAGLAVHLDDAGSASLDSADGQAIGISRGKTIDGASDKTLVEVAGSKVAMQLTAELETTDFLLFAKQNDGVALSFEMVDDGTAGSETIGITTNADGSKKITVHMEAAQSDADDIVAVIEGDEDVSVLIGITLLGVGSEVQAALAEAALTGSYAVPGTPVFKHTDNGKACSDGDETGAVYASGPLTGIDEAGGSQLAALIDLQSGLN